ncbi:MAG: hypothetical protein U0996_10625 [Planctomycetaceae bacterium]
MPAIFPILKPHDWPHRHLVAHRLIGDNIPGAPVVAFGFDAGQQYQFVPASKAGDLESLFVEALGNLATLNYGWELGESNGLPFAASSGKEFSAERVLDSKAMQECQRLLKAKRILVAAPRRTCLMATREGLPDDVMALFVQLVFHTYNDDSYGHAPISPAIFVLEDGVIQSVLIPTEKPDTSSPALKPKPWWKFWR